MFEANAGVSGISTSMRACNTAGGGKQQVDATIVSAMPDVPLLPKDSALALVYKTTIDNIHQALQGQHGSNALASESTVARNHPPETRAGLIVSTVMDLFDQYRCEHPEMDDITALANFLSVAQEGVVQGFSEARDALSAPQ
ncbi:hypothetical protein K788_0000073 [Paraburkholderia caribensis MBA4]|uniref:DUF5610 domain-containing protein n=1 Tax=Paraburkholderia caribensis MBA4 TaxID=1323664 RepID=A0A0N7JVD7_9BURK|nr:DUF5610 domain-containing protein [Paraburkholderia caribensis]ALL68925.1 hypothetical protein K788_0000073 [Paraburkholderia caribensis MBA4]